MMGLERIRNHGSEGIQKMVAGGICILVTECWHNKPTLGRVRLLTELRFSFQPFYHFRELQTVMTINVGSVIRIRMMLIPVCTRIIIVITINLTFQLGFTSLCVLVHVLTWWNTHWWVLPSSIITAVNSTVSHQSGATIAEIICSCSPRSTYRVTCTKYTCSAICNLWRSPTIN